MAFQKLVSPSLGLILGIFLVSGCGAQPAEPQPEAPESTHTPIPPAATLAPLDPTATSKPQAALAGEFEVNNMSLYLECLGTGAPTILLLLGEGSTDLQAGDRPMKALQSSLAGRTMTCAYDRARRNGLTTAQDVADDLHS